MTKNLVVNGFITSRSPTVSLKRSHSCGQRHGPWQVTRTSLSNVNSNKRSVNRHFW